MFPSLRSTLTSGMSRRKWAIDRVQRKCSIRPFQKPTFKVSTVGRAKNYSQMNAVRIREIDKTSLGSLIAMSKEYVLIDVREPTEVIESGYIKTSRNLPLSELKTAFLLSPRAFEERYLFRKPTKDDMIVFYCKTGERSGEATYYVATLGYNNVYNYPGSPVDWEHPFMAPVF